MYRRLWVVMFQSSSKDSVVPASRTSDMGGGGGVDSEMYRSLMKQIEQYVSRNVV